MAIFFTESPSITTIQLIHSWEWENFREVDRSHQNTLTSPTPTSAQKSYLLQDSLNVVIYMYTLTRYWHSSVLYSCKTCREIHN